MRNSATILFMGCTLRTTTGTAEKLLIQTRENHLQDTPLSERSRGEWRACIFFLCRVRGDVHVCDGVHTHIYTHTYRLIHIGPCCLWKMPKKWTQWLPWGRLGDQEGEQNLYFSLSLLIYSTTVYQAPTMCREDSTQKRYTHKILSFWSLHSHRRDNQ